MTEKKLAALLAEMSLEEKVMQLVQLPGSAYDDTANITEMNWSRWTRG